MLVPTPQTDFENHALDEVDRLSREFAETAIERDRAGGTPKRERDQLRASGLLALTIPRRFGGAGLPLSTLLEAVRRFARVDPSLAHVFGFHHLMLATVRMFGAELQWTEAYKASVAQRLFWGNALNPKDTRTRLVISENELRIVGIKSFCSGAIDSDRLVVSALDDRQRLAVLVLPSDREGIEMLHDWDAIGQRQTDSGTVVLKSVRAHAHEILRQPGPLGTPFASLRPCLAQAILVHIYLGIAEGAFEAGRAQVRGTAELFRVDSYDTQRLVRWGELVTALESARLLAQRARDSLDAAWLRAEALTAEERGETAMHIALAKVLSTQCGLRITNEVFELIGARSLQRGVAFDRFWRNLRTHSLHDPLDHKLRELGAWTLAEEPPVPSFYS